MKRLLNCMAFCILIVSCVEINREAPVGLEKPPAEIEGTWKLVTAETIVNNDTTTTVFSGGVEGIKIIGQSHFSFFQHDLKHGTDSTARYSSGAGKYVLDGNRYTEFLEYCNARQWENHKFDFTVSVSSDTLIQTGIERIASLGVDRTIH